MSSAFRGPRRTAVAGWRRPSRDGGSAARKRDRPSDPAPGPPGAVPGAPPTPEVSLESSSQAPAVGLVGAVDLAMLGWVDAINNQVAANVAKMADVVEEAGRVAALGERAHQAGPS